MPKPIASSKNNDLSKRITFTGTISSINFEVMYRIKIKRICKGYSQQELAFLLGKDKDYVSDRERFESNKIYTFPDINRLSFILDYDCSSFIPLNPAKKGRNIYTGLEIREGGKIHHEVSIKSSRSTKLLFKVEEDDREVINFPANEERQLGKLKTFMAALCEIGYFKEVKTPFQIFLCCYRIMPNYTSARLIEQAVNHFIQQKKIKKAVREGYTVYESK